MGIAKGSITENRHALSLVFASDVGVGVVMGLFVVELRQELRRRDFVSSIPGKRRTPSKYVRWNDVFIYRTVESVRRRSRRHRNSPYSLAVMAILCCAEVPPYVVVCVDDVCDPLFSAASSPSPRPSSSSSSVPYAAIVTLRWRITEKGNF